MSEVNVKSCVRVSVLWTDSLVKAGRVGVVEVAVGVHPAESSQTDPAETLLTGRTGHLVTAVHLLQEPEQ